MAKKLVIFGNGDTARMAHFYFTTDSPHDVAAFTVDQDYMDPETSGFLGLPIVPFEAITRHYPPDEYDMFVAVGYDQVNRVKAQKYDEAKSKGYRLATYVSSHATCLIDPVRDIGDNCLIMEDNTIQPFVRIGSNVTLWSGNHIGHDATIKDHVFISSHVVVSGHVVVEPYCFLGVNATLRDHITIAESCVIGAGALILKDTEPGGVYTVPPAEKRRRSSSELTRI